MSWQLSPQWVLEQASIIPVVTIHDLAEAVTLADALLSKNIQVMEITLRTNAALNAISELRLKRPEMLIGAGTVLNQKHLEQSAAAGAQFALSPGLTADLLHAGTKSTIPLIPGLSSVSELMLGLEYGYTCFKFFPAEAMGGVQTLKAIHGPFPNVRFCPTGGINAGNFKHYLNLPNVLCVGGSWIIP